MAMRKALLAGALAVLLLTSTALAEVYEGTTAAASCILLEAPSGGILEELNVEAGEIVEEGDVIGEVRTTRVFAQQDGAVVSISAGEGDDVEGAVLEISPLERYQIYCTVDSAYQSAESTLVHSGERVYMKCTSDGTHRGVGMITEIDGEEFRVQTIGGELYVGETVYLYRDSAFSVKQRVGVGTVVVSDTETYEGRGRIARMHVTEGEYVERGELLYEIIDGDSSEIVAPATGIVTEISAAQGDRIDQGQNLLTIVPGNEICIEVLMDETAAANVAVGDAATIVYAADPEERACGGVVTEISMIAEEGAYLVKIRPDDTQGLKLGMTATVRMDGV